MASTGGHPGFGACSEARCSAPHGNRPTGCWTISSLLPLAGPGGGEAAHVMQVRSREPGHVGKVAAQVRGETVDDLCAPSLPPLAIEDVAPDPPSRA